MFPYFRKGTYIATLAVVLLLVSGQGVLLYWQFFHTSLWGSILINLPPLLLLYLFSLSSWFLCVNLEFKPPRIALNIFYLVISSVVIIGTWFSLSLAYVTLLSRPPDLQWLRVTFMENIYFTLSLGTIVYLTFILIHYLVITIEGRRDAELRATRNTLEKTRIELKFLKAAIHPHFLFNSLNLLSPLIRRDPPRARETLTHLSEFLLYSLQFGKKESVDLEGEMAHIRHYLAIEKMRLQERLEINTDLDTELLAYQLPPLTLLPVVENAVKHGIEPRVRGGSINLSVQRAAPGKLRIRIQNPVAEEGPPMRGSGLGLQILRRRLQDFFGSGVTIALDQSGESFAIEIIIPCKEKL